MQNTESNPNNASCSLEQRLNSLFDELKYQRKIFKKIANQNAILMTKVNAIEQFIYQYMHRDENKESVQKIEIKEPEEENSTDKKNRPRRRQKLQSPSPSKNNNENEDKENDSNNNQTLRMEKLQDKPKSKDKKSPHAKIVIPSKNKAKIKDANPNIKINPRLKKPKLEEDSKHESEPSESENSESSNDQVEKVHFISKSKENAKKSPELWQKYIEKKTNSLPFKIGYLGEAYVYESLLKMKCFSKVTWNANTKNENNPYVTLNNGTRYFIDEDGDHYDIVAEDFNNIKYYFEIKSTQNSSRNYNIKKRQREFYAALDPAKNVCVVAVVKKVLESPSITYCLYDPVNETCKRKITEKEAEENFMKYIAENRQNETSNEILDDDDD